MDSSSNGFGAAAEKGRDFCPIAVASVEYLAAWNALEPEVTSPKLRSAEKYPDLDPSTRL